MTGVAVAAVASSLLWTEVEAFIVVVAGGVF